MPGGADHESRRTPGLAFLVVAGVFGTLLALLSPPMRWGDENTHFVEAYRLSELNFATTMVGDRRTANLPRAIKKLLLVLALERHVNAGARMSAARLLQRFAIETAPDQRRQLALGSANYPPLGYVPQAIGIALTRVFTRSILLQLYGARLANLAVWLALMWLAIRVAPIFKLALALLALAPMSVFLAATLAADPLANGLAFLWSAWMLRLATTDAVSRGTVARLGVLAVALALVKLLYAPLILLLLAVPAARFGGRPQRRAAVTALLGASVACLAVWVLYARTAITHGIAHRGQAALDANVALLVTDPLAVAQLLAETVLRKGRSWVYQLIDAHWGPPLAPEILLWMWLAAIALAILAEPRGAGWPSLVQRAVAATVVVGVLATIILCAFLFWSENAGEITGVQGRYAIPLLPALLIALCPPAGLALPPRSRSVAALAAFALAAASLAHTVYRGTQLYV